MKSRKGFTLIELMVVILIIGILAGVAIPILRGRIDAAKWSEGRAGIGTIATALRAYAAEKGAAGTYGGNLPTMADLGFSASDLHGTYFNITNYSVIFSIFIAAGDPQLIYIIRATNVGTGITRPTSILLNQAGTWTEINP